MRYSFDDPSAPSARRTQFYSMLGSRAIWHDGWKAITTHPTISGWSHFNDDVWELYHTDTDRSELHDLSAEQPGKVREMVNLWFAEAGANGAFPLDDRSALEILQTPRPRLASPRNRYVYYYGDRKVGEGRIKNQPGYFELAGEGLCVGRDSGAAVTDDYPGQQPWRFTGGTIKRVAIDVSGRPYVDLEREAQAMLARE